MKVNLLLSALATFAAALPSGGKRENETYNPDTRDCNDCKDRYEHCVKVSLCCLFMASEGIEWLMLPQLAGVSGLPWCENICRVRVKEGYGTVDNASREVVSPLIPLYLTIPR